MRKWKNPLMLVYGEDVQDERCFTATKVFQQNSVWRCFNSPGEASIGTAVGAALTGLKPVVEIRFTQTIYGLQ
jgi:pyruvate/2-oxoglutarate/acetoin dehydrogenase E1 component